MDYYKEKTLRFATIIMKKLTELIVIICLSAYYHAETLILTLTPSMFRHEKNLENKVILITGGAGGVGRQLVKKLAKNDQAIVVVWDNNEKALEKLKNDLKEQANIHYYVVDITDRKNVYKTADQVKDEVGNVNVLINNAGVVCGQTFLDIPDYMIEKTYKVNVLSNYWTIKAFLPSMLKHKNGHIVTISSLTGLLGTYKCTDYSASKFATVGLHESLLLELKTHGHDYIKMSIICPYFINTGMFEGCNPKMHDWLKPDDVAERIITAIKREEVFVTIPGYSRFASSLKFWIPAKLSWELMYRVVKGPQSMMGLRKFQEVEAA